MCVDMSSLTGRYDGVRKDDSAPVYVVVGDGGNREGHADGYFVHLEDQWSAYKNDTQVSSGLFP